MRKKKIFIFLSFPFSAWKTVLGSGSAVCKEEGAASQLTTVGVFRYFRGILVWRKKKQKKTKKLAELGVRGVSKQPTLGGCTFSMSE